MFFVSKDALIHCQFCYMHAINGHIWDYEGFYYITTLVCVPGIIVWSIIPIDNKINKENRK